MARLSVSLLGSWQMLLDGEPVTGFESDKARLLLTYLLLESDRCHRREVLAGMLWPERPEQDARHSLSQALLNLRRVLGGCEATQAGPAGSPFLKVTRQTVQFDRASDHWMDTAAIAERLDACKQHDHRRLDLCEPCIERLQQALDLYRGDLLAGFSLGDCLAFEEWLLLQRERYHRLAVSAVRSLVTCHERRGEHRQALRYARRYMALEPWREQAHRQAMRALAAIGQRNEALVQYQACRRILKTELGVEPEEETARLYRRVCDREALPPPAALPVHNLPAPVSPFVGRAAELAGVKARLRDPDCRLLTLVGPGGIGKTRLALEAGRDLLLGDVELVDQDPPFPQGIYLVPLEPLRSPEALVPALGEALGFPCRRKRELARFTSAPALRRQLLDYLRGRRLLVILDGFDHLLEGATLVSEILRAAPGVKVLATSQSRLNVQGEYLYPVPALEVPEPAAVAASEIDRIRQCSTVELFSASARRVRPCFEATADELRHVAQICRLAQGVPLAILLAAAWMETLSPGQIVALIAERSIDFWQADWRDVPESQRNMRAVLDRSWSLLTPRQQEVLAGLSVFRGGFTGEAAQQVVGASSQELAGLVHRSLLWCTVAPSVADVPFASLDTLGKYPTMDGCCEMHELLRQYAAEKLQEMPEAGHAARERHVAYLEAALQG